MSVQTASNPRKPAMKAGSVTLSSPETKRLEGIGSGIRVIIVEDERDTLMTLGVLLRSEGFDVRLASAGDEVVGHVDDFKPHAVLLDIGMPGKDGYQVAAELRATYGAECPTLIAVTAYSSPADKERAVASGFHHHIEKPYDPVRLLAVLAAFARKP